MSASGIDLGAAYLAILPDTSKIAPGVRSAFGDVERQAGRSGKRSGHNFAGAAASAVKRLGPLIAAGLVVKGGLNRLLQIDDARAKLRGMGLEAAGIAKVQASVDAAVTGTAFSLADGMNAATTAMASGVKAGADLEKYLRLIGDVATQGGAEYGEMASIINQVTARGKVGQENLNRLTERGIGIQSMLAKYYGVSGDELQTMLRKGQVGVGDFQRVLEDNFAGSAQKAGETVRGSFANMRTSMSRLGAAILEPAFAQAPAIFQSITGAVKGLSAEGGPAQRAGEAIGNGLKAVVDAAGNAKDYLGGFSLDPEEIDGEALGNRIAEAVRAGISKLSGMAGELATVIGKWANRVDWVGLGIEFGKAAVPLVLGLALGILNFDVVGLFSSLMDHWKVVLLGALALIFAPAKLLKPIAKIVGKIPFLGPLLTWFAKSFRSAGRAVFGFIGDLFRNLWKGFKFQMGWLGPGLIARFINMLRGLFPRLKEWASDIAARLGDAFRFAFFQAGRAIARGVSNVIGRMRSFVGDIRNTFTGAGSWLVQTGRDLLAGLGQGIRGAVGKVKDALTFAIRQPIAAAKGILAGFIGLINGIPGVDIPNPFAETTKPVKDYGSDRAMASRGFAEGGWTGPGGKYKPAGVVHADEFVVSKAARRAFEAANPGALDHLNRTGMLPGYSSGGRVVPGVGRQHMSGYPWATWAGDFPNPIGTPVRAWKDGVVAALRSMTTSYGKHIRMNHDDGTSSLYAHLSKFSTAVGDRVRQGAKIGEVGSTGNSTGPHLHAEFLGGHYSGSEAKSSVWDTLKGAAGRIGSWIKEHLLAKANIGGLFGDVSGLFSEVGNGLKDRLLGGLFDSGGLASGVGVLAKGTVQPERVLSPRQTRAFEAALARDFDGSADAGSGTTLHVVRADVDLDSVELLIEERIDGYDAQQGQNGRRNP